MTLALQEDSKCVQHSVHKENSLPVNPNERNANASSRNKCPNTLSHLQCQRHAPDPVRICANSNIDHKNGETDLLSPCSKKVINKDELNNAGEEIADLADS